MPRIFSGLLKGYFFWAVRGHSEGLERYISGSFHASWVSENSIHQKPSFRERLFWASR